MDNYTPHQSRYFAEQILLKRPPSSYESIASAMSGVKVDLNPHQVDAALFAVQSPLSNGAILADEVGLGKTIEAGLVLAQCWAERKRKILLIVPAALRIQWLQELEDKFFIGSVLMESAIFNKLSKNGVINPFEQKNKVVICSYDFAARKQSEIKSIEWDLVIMDEAHRLRNVYRSNNVTGKKLKAALNGRKKLLLTATPLQNNLMELFGLVSIIDDHVFGDAKTFREMYVSVSNTEVRNYNLRNRLQTFCKRTLRSQVAEYVPYTNRIAILQRYTPTKDEKRLYNFVSDYLQTDKLYALPQGQRTLITMVLRKLLASSSFAISGTLTSLINRLNDLLHGVESKLDLDDFDTYNELADESDADEDIITADLVRDCEGIKKELAQLEQFAKLAKSITSNSKGDNLLTALQQGFQKTEELGGQRKAVIFTESRRTQEYLLKLLSDNGFDGQAVFLNGSNNDAISKRILEEWKERHKDDGRITGSRTADMKAAIVEEFRDRASILIGTEAAAEGINLQFCSLVVNYDLPWNPQRIEQRIGRCHRYGQKNDVVVINFLDEENAADVRVYQLLDQKFKLFSGVFGSSDEVLGSIESGVDFEKRIAAIYQKCKNAQEIQRSFDALQEEMADVIDEKMKKARQSILENFDEEVAARLKDCKENTVASMSTFSRWIYYFFLIHGAERVEPLDQLRIRLEENGQTRTYNLDWKSADELGDTFLRREDPLYGHWLEEATAKQIAPAMIEFDYSGQDRKISYLAKHLGMEGIIAIEKLSYSSIGEEEHLVITARASDGTVLDEDTVNSLFELPGAIIGECPAEIAEFSALRQQMMELQKQRVDKANKAYYLQECAKLDAYSDDLKEGLKHDLKELKKAITAKRKEFQASTNLPLSGMLDIKDELEKLKRKRKQMEREINIREDEIDNMNERLQQEIRGRLEGSSVVTPIMTIGFRIK